MVSESLSQAEIAISPEGAFRRLLDEMRLPLDLVETEAVLKKIDAVLSPAEGAPPEPETVIELAQVLIGKMLFYILVLTAQNCLIRDMRNELRRQEAVSAAGE